MTRHYMLCGCLVVCIGDTEHEPRVIYCPMHEAAPEVLAALERMIDSYAEHAEGAGADYLSILREARAVARKARGAA